MELSDIIGTADLDKRSLRQLTGPGGFIDRYEPAVTEPAKQDPLGWLWIGKIGRREVTVLTVIGKMPPPLQILSRPDIDAILCIRPLSVTLMPTGRYEAEEKIRRLKELLQDVGE